MVDDDLIDALARLAQQALVFRAVLVGTRVDERNTALMQRLDAAGLGERVRLLGPTSDAPAVMNALDVHVLSWPRPWPAACPA